MNLLELLGILLLIRHGVRASLNHVRDSSIDCSHEKDAMLSKYRHYLLNSTLSGPNGNNNGHAAWNRQGPFHGFPMLPVDTKICLLGQLTYKGISQLLHVGELMKFAYANALDLLRKPPAAPKPVSNSTENVLLNQILNSDDIVVFSTRYRRTFQSAMALLFNILPTDRWHNIQVQESHSLAYCFSDCACPNAEYLKRLLSKAKSKDFLANPVVASLVNWIGTSLLQSQDLSILNPLELRDVLLMYLCHNQELPCQRNVHQATTPSQRDADSNDVIDLDDSDQSPDSPTTKDDDDDLEEAIPNNPTDNCIEQSHVETLLTYTNLFEMKESRNRLKIMERLLRAYGLIRNIVNYMLKMISGDKLKMVLYSSHDQTIQNVLAAVGLLEESAYIPYATRMSFEVYRSDADNQHYFRLLYNGKDVTKKMTLCLDGKSLRVNRGRGRAAYLCPIENIIRFIHDDYFTMMNATNFKDACFFEKNSYF